MCINSTLKQILQLCVWDQGEGRGRWKRSEQGPWIYNPEGPSPWSSLYPSSGYLLPRGTKILSTIFTSVILPFTFFWVSKFALPTGSSPPGTWAPPAFYIVLCSETYWIIKWITSHGQPKNLVATQRGTQSFYLYDVLRFRKFQWLSTYEDVILKPYLWFSSSVIEELVTFDDESYIENLSCEKHFEMLSWEPF